jgi:fructose-bisphosphate aldolase class I
MDKALLELTASKLVAPGKGILAADESNGTMTKRLEGVGLESSEEARRAYRSNLFATPGCEDAISGVILYDETIRQSMDDGTPIPDYLASRGIIPGIKVDTGVTSLAGTSGEKITEGLDGLQGRCEEYFAMGARFAKWRAVIQIADGLPSKACIHANAHALARYAAICQDAGLVPIIEPEVLMNGTHTTLDCYKTTSDVLDETWRACDIMGVHLPGVLLKPNMILPGNLNNEDVSDGTIANGTIRALMLNVPPSVEGIVFLSGGQSDEEATRRLNLMNDSSFTTLILENMVDQCSDDEDMREFISDYDLSHIPWQLSYSYGRALQAAALEAWAEEGAEASQAAFAHRAKMNSLARSGDWDIELESQ